MFGPRNIHLQDIAIHTLGACIAGFVGSLTILLTTFFVSGLFDMWAGIQILTDTQSMSPLFPLLLSFITFLWTMLTLFLLSFFMHMIDPERYKNNSLVSWQLAFLGIITYICMTPVYLYYGKQNSESLLLIFMLHSLVLWFWSSLLLEILNNYRYVLLSFYGNFIGIFFTTLLGFWIFHIFDAGYAKLLALFLLLPVIFWSVTFFKGLFEFLYYQYYSFTNMNQLGDIFSQIERREQEELLEETQKNTL